MPQPPNRTPRAPERALNLKQPEIAEDVFVDEALHVGLLLEGVRFAACEADKVEVKRFAFTKVDLSGAKLDGLYLENGSIHDSDLANLRSRRCNLSRVVISASRLTGVVLTEPRLIDVLFRDCLIDLSSFRFGRFDRVRFERCRLVEADFQGVTAKACTFIDCDLTSAQLSQANFTGSAFRGCRLAGLKGLDGLKGAEMAWVDVMELATAFAASLGIAVSDEIS